MKQTLTRTASDTTLRFLAFVALSLLLIEFLFGMLVNLYASIPSPLPGTTPANSGGALRGMGWALGQTSMPVLVVHVVLGLALVVISLALLVLSLVARQGQWVVASLIATVGLILATLSGSNFVASGMAASSLVMTIGFLLAVIPYALALYLTRPTGQTA